jgi:hypothetical protein
MITSLLILSLFIGFLSASPDNGRALSSGQFTFSNQDELDIVIRNLHRHLAEKDKTGSLECARYALKVILNFEIDNFEIIRGDVEFVGSMASIIRSYLNEKLFEMSDEELGIIKDISFNYIEKIRLESDTLLYFWYAYRHKEKILPHYESHVKRLMLVINAEKAMNEVRKKDFEETWLENAIKLNRKELLMCLEEVKQKLLPTEN